MRRLRGYVREHQHPSQPSVPCRSFAHRHHPQSWHPDTRRSAEAVPGPLRASPWRAPPPIVWGVCGHCPSYGAHLRPREALRRCDDVGNAQGRGPETGRRGLAVPPSGPQPRTTRAATARRYLPPRRGEVHHPPQVRRVALPIEAKEPAESILPALPAQRRRGRPRRHFGCAAAVGRRALPRRGGAGERRGSQDGGSAWGSSAVPADLRHLRGRGSLDGIEQ